MFDFRFLWGDVYYGVSSQARALLRIPFVANPQLSIPHQASSPTWPLHSALSQQPSTAPVAFHAPSLSLSFIHSFQLCAWASQRSEAHSLLNSHAFSSPLLFPGFQTCRALANMLFMLSCEPAQPNVEALRSPDQHRLALRSPSELFRPESPPDRDSPPCQALRIPCPSSFIQHIPTPPAHPSQRAPTPGQLNCCNFSPQQMLHS